ncbi:MAG TPA: Fe-S cluster assembly protein SufD, partial [Gemmatales bacterium]|nr:Fe-S cluster assembly protein SufD [Gemmatales bacterium]
MKTLAPSSEAQALHQHLLASFEKLEKQVAASDTPFLRRLRSSAIARFSTQGFPTTRDEEWRFTPLNTLYQQKYSLCQPPTVLADQLPILLPEVLPLVVVDGVVDTSLSQFDKWPKGCTILRLHDALKSMPQLVEGALGRLANTPEATTWAALNAAFLQDGIVIHLPKECVLAWPIHISWLESASGVMSFPRLLLVAEQHSQATLIETCSSLGEQPDFTCSVSEFILAERARLDHYRMNVVHASSQHFTTQLVTQQRDSNFRSHAFTLGGGLVRNALHAHLSAQNCEATLNGLYIADGNRLVDNHTSIDHVQPHCNSHEIYKGILRDRGRGVFNGKIFVRQDAQKTNAKQTNQTLLLSPDASIDTKPQLEIFADDVKCTHGATVGQLDGDMQFYLRSRGIPQEQAEIILTYAFANDLISKVQVDSL